MLNCFISDILVTWIHPLADITFVFKLLTPGVNLTHVVVGPFYTTHKTCGAYLSLNLSLQTGQHKMPVPLEKTLLQHVPGRRKQNYLARIKKHSRVYLLMACKNSVT
jgi:hypothetical protein